MIDNITHFILWILYIKAAGVRRSGCSMQAAECQRHEILYTCAAYDAVSVFRKRYKTHQAFDLVYIAYSLDIMEGILLAGEFINIDCNINIILRARSLAALRKIEAAHASSENIYISFSPPGTDQKKLFGQVIEKRLKQYINTNTED